MGVLFDQSAYVPGLALNPYQRMNNLIYLFTVAAGKIRTNDPDAPVILKDIQYDVELAEQLLFDVGGSAPSLLSQWNGIINNLASVGVYAGSASRVVTQENGERGDIFVTIGDTTSLSPGSSDDLQNADGSWKEISPVPTGAPQNGFTDAAPAIGGAALLLGAALLWGLTKSRRR